MDLTPFTTTPCSPRHDGWSPALKVRFLDHLAGRGNVAAACTAVGMSREAAYRLRRRDVLFARGWAAALMLAREAGADALADMALGGIEEEVWHRGELKGTRRRFDSRLLLAHIARLDRLAEQTGARAAEDVERFEEILACMAGAKVPEALQVADEPLPLDRESALAMAEKEAAEAVEEVWDERETETEAGVLPDDTYEIYRHDYFTAVAAARSEAASRWDAWHANACATVDGLLGGSVGHGGAKAAAGTLSGSSTSDGAQAAPRTPSDSSTSAAAVAVGPNGRPYAYA